MSCWVGYPFVLFCFVLFCFVLFYFVFSPPLRDDSYLWHDRFITFFITVFIIKRKGSIIIIVIVKTLFIIILEGIRSKKRGEETATGSTESQQKYTSFSTDNPTGVIITVRVTQTTMRRRRRSRRRHHRRETRQTLQQLLRQGEKRAIGGMKEKRRTARVLRPLGSPRGFRIPPK